jgi:hypothetical protein
MIYQRGRRLNRSWLRWLPLVTFAGLLLPDVSLARAQDSRDVAPRLVGRLAHMPPPGTTSPTFRSLQDSLEWAAARELAHDATERRLIIDLFERRLFWVDGVDTLFAAIVAVGSGDTLSYRNHEWQFETPRGRRVIRAKEENPVWIPPLWHYVQHARETDRELVHLRPERIVPLSDGTHLMVRGNEVGRMERDGTFYPAEPQNHIIFDGILFVPPLGTVNRQISGELGRYKLDLGDAYLIHGTPHKDSIGRAVTRGCIRLGDEDLEYLYENVRVGTPVYIY